MHAANERIKKYIGMKNTSARQGGIRKRNLKVKASTAEVGFNRL
jgi:hypothetical protein